MEALWIHPTCLEIQLIKQCLFQLKIKVVQQILVVKEEIKTFPTIHQEAQDQIFKLQIHQLKTQEVRT
jgi:hypothetical protein